MAASTVQSLQVMSTEIAGVKLIVPRIHQDDRGLSSETCNKEGLTALGTSLEFVQDNHSLSVEGGVALRSGFQIPRFVQSETAAAPSQRLVP